MTTKRVKVDFSSDNQTYWRKRAKALSLGQVIRAHRLAEDWSLTHAAERAGISKQQLSDYENERKLPSIEKAYQLARALGMMPQSVVLQVINEQLIRSHIPIRIEVAS